MSSRSRMRAKRRTNKSNVDPFQGNEAPSWDDSDFFFGDDEEAVTVGQVFNDFVAECRQKLPEKHLDTYESTINLFKSSMQGQGAGEEDPAKHLIFYVPRFLAYFMVRKVNSTGKKDIQKAAQVVKKLISIHATQGVRGNP
eukprot:gb/GECG01005962.1/.p1 GENE.gb/GECG01005962.1/~~gb/GECG01005962.1/.p1  ORF type:complete len:141 (+),score=20.13 gb/GECG01005962.1/:1-423(+)